MSDRCIVNVAVGKNYPDEQRRLANSLRRVGYDGDHIFWVNGFPGGIPHDRVPYLFKQTAMREAADRAPLLLWLDAAMVASQPVDRVFQQIKEDGYIFWAHTDGWNIGEWTSDACLDYYGISREKAFHMPMLCSAVFGYSLEHPLGKQLHKDFLTAPASVFAGPWNNLDRKRLASSNPWVRGHRHDQSVLSIIAQGLKFSKTPDPVAFLGHETGDTVFVHVKR